MASLLDDSVNVPRCAAHEAAVRPASVRTQVFAKLINNVQTDFCIINYSNRVLIFITQCAKIGNLFSVRQDTAQKNGITSPSPLFIYEISCLLGSDSEEITQAIRSLAEKLYINKPILLSLTLPVPDHRTVILLSEALLEHKCW
ncbi:hypothetical protein SK128_026586 [Halocaridina rubra]|uniref:Proteasome assembly chaperone 3 n=1 Tax=Halocaridina rubra TaxID=373956 RepID=A0AAN9A3V7_HALRR